MLFILRYKRNNPRDTKIKIILFKVFSRLKNNNSTYNPLKKYQKAKYPKEQVILSYRSLSKKCKYKKIKIKNRKNNKDPG